MSPTAIDSFNDLLTLPLDGASRSWVTEPSYIVLAFVTSEIEGDGRSGLIFLTFSVSAWMTTDLSYSHKRNQSSCESERPRWKGRLVRPFPLALLGSETSRHQWDDDQFDLSMSMDLTWFSKYIADLWRCLYPCMFEMNRLVSQLVVCFSRKTCS